MENEPNMNYLANKPLRFSANRYEEWMQGQCISQGSSSAVITAEIIGSQIHFRIENADNLRIIKEAYYNLADDSADLGSRIQYVKSDIQFNPNDPIVCHLFYEGRALTYIRFAMTSPDRIIEFYGNYESFDGTEKPVFTMGKPRFKTQFTEELTDLYRSLLKGNTINLAIMDHQFAVVAFCLRKYCALCAINEAPDESIKERIFIDASSIVSQFYPHFGDEALDDARNWFYQILDLAPNAPDVFIEYYYHQLLNGEDFNYQKLFGAFRLH